VLFPGGGNAASSFTLPSGFLPAFLPIFLFVLTVVFLRFVTTAHLFAANRLHDKGDSDGMSEINA
jgi:hypothetical protein